MSDNYITLVPKNPYFIPPKPAVEAAVVRLAEVAPSSDHIMPMRTDDPAFYDAGSNLSDIHCPACNTSLELEWWQEAMDTAYQDGTFSMSEFEVPCCGARQTLNTLHYNWPQAFGVFAIEMMNANVGRLSDSFLNEMEELLGTQLIAVYQHL